MKQKQVRVAIIYSPKAKKTSQVVELIHRNSGWNNLENIDVENIMDLDFSNYDLLILGVPSWFDGELPVYWDEVAPFLEDINLKGKKVAIFGNANQVNYPENFADAIGILSDIVSSAGAKVVGYTSAVGYNFIQSKALEGELFKGLILDFENQQKKNEQRVKAWLQSLEETLQSDGILIS